MPKDASTVKPWDWWDTPEWRRAQSHVDSDIEGLARDEAFSAYAAELDKQDLSMEEKFARLAAKANEVSEVNIAARSQLRHE